MTFESMAPKLFSLYYKCGILLSFICLWLLAPLNQANQTQRETYIVYMGDRINPDGSAKSLHIDMLSNVLEGVPSHKVSEHLLYSYENFHGCVAILTEDEAEVIAGMNGVVSVFRNENVYHHTTRSWDFMGVLENVERSNIESDVIVGVIDSGIWPESESFQDEGLSPPPTKWKGRCQTSQNFTCNNKIIGAQYFRADGNFSKDEPSPRDTVGHGTHTASIVAGRVVQSASFLGLGQGIARGGVPSARIAVYKTCWSYEGCKFADVLAAFDAAISDGVDIISVSLGNPEIEALPYFRDPIAIGSFHAMKRGILTSTPSGNTGPGLRSLSNYAPWLLTVGAGTIDRKFITNVQLDNGLVFEGISLNTFDLENKTFPLIYGGDAPDTLFSNSTLSRYCLPDSLNKTLVEGKIVVCDMLLRPDRGLEEVFVDGAAGTIMHFVEPNLYDTALSFPLPASYVRDDDAVHLIAYTRNLTSTPFGTIHKSVEVKDASAPYVASFSSRGPHPLSPHILKPDLIAPGVDILAAWSPVASVSRVEGDPRSVPYTIASGTSMACPHATAVAAYVKSFHPTWSAAAIRSALMTTALPMSHAKNGEAELSYGSGYINPLKAVNPGLVYDAEEVDYVKFLCSQGLDDNNMNRVTGDNSSCQGNTTNWDLNYPSIALPTSVGSFSSMFTRTVTNVGSPNSTYNAVVTTPQGQALSIKVQPSVLSFNSLGQKITFTVRVSGTIGMRALISSSLVWDDGQHQVRSPIVVFNLS